MIRTVYTHITDYVKSDLKSPTMTSDAKRFVASMNAILGREGSTPAC